MMLVTFMAPVWCDASLLELLESKHGMRGLSPSQWDRGPISSGPSAEG